MSVIAPAVAAAPRRAAFAGDALGGRGSGGGHRMRLISKPIDRAPARTLASISSEDWPERLVREAIARGAARSPPRRRRSRKACSVLRRAKDAVHLAVAIADLARRVAARARHRRAERFRRRRLARGAGARRARDRRRAANSSPATSPTPRRARSPGFALIAMGKMGAGELNYSSDIDFSVFFDAEALCRRRRARAARGRRAPGRADRARARRR